MVNLSELLNGQSLLNAKPPELLPDGDYPCVITKHEFRKAGDADLISYSAKLTGWPAGEDPVEGIDVTKRFTNVDFWLDAERMHRLATFLKLAGVEDNGQGDDAMLAEPVGAALLVTIKQEPAKKGSEELVNRGKAFKAF